MKGIAISELPERYQKQVRAQLVAENCIPGKTTDMEPNTSNALHRKEKAPGFDGQVNIAFREKRYRLADPDGSCVKYVLDALVTCRVLQDDSAKEIGKVSKEQIKIDKNEQEETVIEIWKT